MSKAELEARIDHIFTPLGLRWYPWLPVGGGQNVDHRYGAIMLEQAWIELNRLVDSLLDMQA